MMSGMNEIDILVTGLPVSQFNGLIRRKEPESKFVGAHKITPKRTVSVKKVQVIPSLLADCWTISISSLNPLTSSSTMMFVFWLWILAFSH